MKGTKADLLQELEERLRFETLLADISTRFINLPIDRIDSEIEEASAGSANALTWIYRRYGRSLEKDQQWSR